MATHATTTPNRTTKEVADGLVKLCSQSKFDEAMKTFYSPDIVSVEPTAPPGESRELRGLQAVQAKSASWSANHEVHSAKVEGPLVAGSHFAVRFTIDMTFKPQNKRFEMDELAVYKVVNGKIVHEEFFYNT